MLCLIESIREGEYGLLRFPGLEIAVQSGTSYPILRLTEESELWS